MSPFDALREKMSEVSQYPVYDDLGVAVPSKYLFADVALSQNGVICRGTDGSGNSVDCIADTIDFVTNSDTYRNAANGNAFPYGKYGASITFTTWLKAPETGSYLLKVEASAASEINGIIEINGEKKEIGSAGGRIGNGFFSTTGVVSSKTGLDIPEKPKPFHLPFAPVVDGDTKAEPITPPPNMPAFMLKEPGAVSFELEAGMVYPITLTVSGKIPEAYDYQRGKKDLQIRLAWVPPVQRVSNYKDAMEASAQKGHKVVIFAHELENLGQHRIMQKTRKCDIIKL